jgi:formylglycine-generating enzyme required for sulfatase activity
VSISDFRLDRHEVTVAAYGQAVDAGVVEAPTCRLEYAWQGEHCNWDKTGRDDHPVNGVDWDDANAYCGWRGLRLPTEAEFEYVLRAQRPEAVYPWGDEPLPPPDYANVVGEETETAGTGWEYIPGYEDGFVGSAPVETFIEDPWGLFDISGNLWEWVGDWYDADGYDPAAGEDPAGPASGERKVLRGAASTACATSCAAPSATTSPRTTG